MLTLDNICHTIGWEARPRTEMTGMHALIEHMREAKQHRPLLGDMEDRGQVLDIMNDYLLAVRYDMVTMKKSLEPYTFFLCQRDPCMRDTFFTSLCNLSGRRANEWVKASYKQHGENCLCTTNLSIVPNGGAVMTDSMSDDGI